MRISAESGVRYLQIFDMFLRWQFASLHIFFHMLFHTEAIVHYDSYVTSRRLRGNELISDPNIFKIWSVANSGANDDKIRLVLLKFQNVVTHSKVNFSKTAFKTQL